MSYLRARSHHEKKSFSENKRLGKHVAIMYNCTIFLHDPTESLVFPVKQEYDVIRYSIVV